MGAEDLNKIEKIEKIRRLRLYRTNSPRFIKCEYCKGIGFTMIIVATKSTGTFGCIHCDGAGYREKTWTEMITQK